MKSIILRTLVISMFLFICFLVITKAQDSPSIIGGSHQTYIDSNGQSLIRISLFVSQNTESILVEEAKFYEPPGASGDIGKSEIKPRPPETMAGSTSKLITIDISFGEDKTIKPTYTNFSLKVAPKKDDVMGQPYSINFSPKETEGIFKALRDNRSNNVLEEQLKEKQKEIDNLKDSLSKFRPVFEWRVIRGYQKLKFTGIFKGTVTKKSAQIKIEKRCPQEESLNVEVSTNSDFDREFDNIPVTSTCEFKVTEVNPSTNDGEKLTIVAKDGASFSPLSEKKIPSISLNSAQRVEAKSKTKVIIPLKVANADHLKVQLFKIRDGQEDEFIDTEPNVEISGGCRNNNINPCSEKTDVVFNKMEYGQKYKLKLSLYSSDPLQDPAILPDVLFNSLSNNFTKSILVTFTEKGIKFTALTGEVKAKLTIAPSLISSAGAKTDGFTTSNNPTFEKDPFIEVDPTGWLTEASNKENLGQPNYRPNGATPAQEQSATRQLQFDVTVTDENGRKETSNISLAIGTPPKKTDRSVKSFVGKVIQNFSGVNSGGNPSLKFNTIGGAIASILGLLIGL